MTLPVPTPSALAQRFATALAGQSFVASDGTTVTLDATAPMTLEQALSIIEGLGDYEIYLFARDIGLELMVTTATENGLLPAHVIIWKTPRIGATAAIGDVIATNTSTIAVTLPAEQVLTVDGSVQWAVTAATVVAPGAAASVPVRATATGTGGNLAANTALTLVSPLPGITSLVTDQYGLSGGAPLEPVESWRSRILESIRSADGGGTISDYKKWARAAGAAYVNVVKGVDGLGTVAVYVLMAGPSVPTPSQVAAIQAYVDDPARRPVRANATVYAGAILVQDPVIALGADTVANQAAVTAALAPVYLAAGMGGVVTLVALEAAIAAAAGNNNDLVSPTADLVLTGAQMAMLGTPSYRPLS